MRLAALGYQAISYDARGHGESQWFPKGDYSLRAFASDLIGLRRKLPGRVALVGASMGGAASFYAVGSERSLTEAIVMVDIALQTATLGTDKVRAFMRSHPAGFADIDEAVSAVMAYNPLRRRPSNPDGLMRNLRARDDGRLRWHWDPALIEDTPTVASQDFGSDLVSVAQNVTVPLLLVRGEHSDVVNDEGIAQMVALVPQTEVFTQAGAGHMIAGDDNDLFNDRIIAFLRKYLPLEQSSKAGSFRT